MYINDWTPLAYAIGNSYMEISKHLIKMGSDTNIKVNDGNTSTSAAKVFEDLQTFSLLVDRNMMDNSTSS